MGLKHFSSLYFARKDSRGFLVVRTILTRVGAWLYGNTRPSLVTFQRNHGKMEKWTEKTLARFHPQETPKMWKFRPKKWNRAAGNP